MEKSPVIQPGEVTQTQPFRSSLCREIRTRISRAEKRLVCSRGAAIRIKQESAPPRLEQLPEEENSRAKSPAWFAFPSAGKKYRKQQYLSKDI